MAIFCKISERHDYRNRIFRFLSGDKFLVSRNTEGAGFYYYYWNSIIINCINIFFFLLIIFSAMALVFISGYAIFWKIFLSTGKLTPIIEGIELIFISPLPLLIITAFNNYYKKIIVPIIEISEFSIRDTDSSGLTGQTDASDLNRNRSMIDMGIIKYLFVSIFISTIFVFMLGKIITIDGEDSSQSGSKELIIQKAVTSDSANFGLVFKSDTGTHKHQLCKTDIEAIKHLQKENLDKNIQYDLFSILLGVVCIILLMIYLKMISKNLNVDIEAAFKFNRMADAGRNEALKKEMENEVNGD